VFFFITKRIRTGILYTYKITKWTISDFAIFSYYAWFSRPL